MNQQPGPFDIARTPLHIASVEDQNSPIEPVANFHFDGPSFGRYVEERCVDGAPGRIVMIEESPTDWGQWECHAQGDEIVFVIEGEGVFLHEIEGEVHSTPFKAGDTFVNPQGVWHTADVTRAMRAIYVTPCPGTDHRPRTS